MGWVVNPPARKDYLSHTPPFNKFSIMTNAIIDARAAAVPLTLEQFEAWEEQYKKERPQMYAERVANGDIERQRVLCGGKPSKKENLQEIAEEVKEEVKAKKK